MIFEIRASGGATCDSCGAHEVVYSGGTPVTADLTRVLEREIVRREIGMAKILRDHLTAATADQTERETRLADHAAVELRDQHWRMKVEHADEMDAVSDLLEGSKVDVSRWRLLRHRRERIFAERVDGIVQEMLAMTARGS